MLIWKKKNNKTLKIKSTLLVTIACLIILGSYQISIAQLQIPSWLKTNAKWWSQGSIKDIDFVSGIQYLIQNEIIKIPNTTTSSNKSNEIPSWIKNNAGWWADGLIGDSDFVLGIQYLISAGIINVNSSGSQDRELDVSECDKFTTPAEKRTCQKEIEQKQKMKNDMAKSIPYEVGPVTFYYVDNKIEKTSQGRTILTIYLIVENTGNSDITLSCTKQNSCNYELYDGQKDIQYTTNTLVYGTLTLKPKVPKFLEWSFFEGLDYDPAKDYSFKINEPWGSGSIQLGID